jgi:Activator of Hsp90 ATPase homolog 1-like protein
MAENKNFTTTIELSKPAKDVFNRISEVSNWWSGDFEGNSSKLNDEFIIHHPHRHYTKQKLVEVIPGKKVVWLVEDSLLYWLEKDKHEWTNTMMIFELTEKGDKTMLQFTHEGLIPEKECYAMCSQGWTMVIREKLFQFIEEG